MCITLSATISPFKILPNMQNTERNQENKEAYILMVPSAASRALLQLRAKKASKNSLSKGYHPRTIS